MIVQVVETDPVVTVTMSLREAEVIRALVGGVGVSTTGRVAQTVKDCLGAFNAAGVRPDETFSDFFVGKVETKPIPQVKK